MSDFENATTEKPRRRAQQADPSKVDRLPPASIEAEQGVLGCILLSPKECLGEARAALKIEKAFYDLRHQVIFECMCDMDDAQDAIDLITFGQLLKDRQQLEAVGGLVYLSSLPDAVPSAANLQYYLSIVHEKWVLRQMIHVCTDAIGRVYEHEGESETLLGSVQRDILAISADSTTQNEVTIKEWVRRGITNIEGYYRSEGKPTGIPSGILDLDKMTNGFKAADYILIAARPSVGKAQPLDATILTPKGFKPMGQIKVGDLVIGGDGIPHKVLGVYPQGKKPVFKVGMSDGTSTRCCMEHLWFTQTRNERRKNHAGSVKALSDIQATLYRGDGGKKNHVIPTLKPVKFEQPWSKTLPLPFHPWLLGALLGDGSLTRESVLFSKPEHDVQQKVLRLLPDGDVGTVIGMDVRIKRKVRDSMPSETRQLLNALGLNGNSETKFIPVPYLLASPGDRLEMLRGLLDTDGFVSGPSVEFSTSSQQLADDVAFLVRSLGGICSSSSRIPKYTHNGLKKDGLRSWRMQIWFEDPSVVPVSSEKHLRKLRLDTRHVHRSIESITPDGEEECQCIMVDSEDHLYVTDEFIVTHNTALCMNIAEYVAVDLKLPVGVFSLEMSGESLIERMLTSRARVNMRKIKDGFMSEQDFPKLTSSAGRLASSFLHIDDTSGISILQLRSRARKMVQQHGIKLFVIDYLQLLHSTNKRVLNRQEEIRDISGGIKEMGKELNVPVIAISQLNREMERDKNRRPRLSDLRESGSLEQDADIIGLLWKRDNEEEDGPREESDSHPVTLVIAKQRNGPTGDVNLTFFKSFTRFESAARISGADL